MNRRSFLSALPALPALPLLPLAGRAAEAVTVGAVGMRATGYAMTWARMGELYKTSVLPTGFEWFHASRAVGRPVTERSEMQRITAGSDGPEWLPWGSPLPVVESDEAAI